MGFFFAQYLCLYFILDGMLVWFYFVRLSEQTGLWINCGLPQLAEYIQSRTIIFHSRAKVEVRFLFVSLNLEFTFCDLFVEKN